METFWRLVTAVVLLASVSHSRRLLLGQDGFARVDSPSNVPVTGITVSSWVNITEFPGGVAPIVTIISEDATYQIAFFLRQDGAGVLWGGPAVNEAAHRPTLEGVAHHVDRQPRSRFMPSEDKNTRKKRNAVDYSMGLGNVMNIMTPRKESSNTWTPMNFVDVSEMGVADLETSGSETHNHYDNWYDVGYELQMQESADPAPRIITQPSGENDFVVINWNRPGAPPLSSNQWDPVGEQEKSIVVDTTQQSIIKAPDSEKFVWSQEENRDGAWRSQLPPAARGDSVTRNSIPPIFSFPTTSKPVFERTFEEQTSERPTRTFVPGLFRKESNDGPQSRPGIFRYASRTTPGTTSAPRTTTASTTTTPATTTTRRPVQVSHEVVRTSQESRVPLWARLKKTSGENGQEFADTTTEEARTTLPPSTTRRTTTTTTTTTPAPIRKLSRPRVPSISRPTEYRASASSLPRITVRPPPPPRRTTQRPSNKFVSKLKSQESQTSPSASKERKYNRASNKHKGTTRHKPLVSHNLDEFRRVLEGKPTVEDNGNKVVVYSMPITDEEAFNRMYEKYQENEARQSPRINLHVVYERAREGHHSYNKNNEDETNQNQLEQIPEPLPVLTYKEEPLHYAETEEVIIEPPREHTLRKPVLAEPIEFIPSYDGASFRPLNPQVPYRPIERDYPDYNPQVENEEIVVETGFDDTVVQPTEDDYAVDVPLLSVAAAALSNLQSPLIYQPAVPTEQHISGQQVGLYHNSARPYERIPQEYLPKEIVHENRFVDVQQRPNEYEDQQIRRSYTVSNQNLQQNLPGSFSLDDKMVAPDPHFLHDKMKAPAPQFLNNNMRAPAPHFLNDKMKVPEPHTTFKPDGFSYPSQSVPASATSAPVDKEIVPEATEEVPLNVNFRKMPYNFETNTWYHLTFTWSSKDHVLRVYINGELAGLLEGTIHDKTVLPTSGVMLLGKTLLPSLTGFDPTSHLNGEMSNYVVWGEALTPLEVNNAFKCQSAPAHPVLLTWSTSPLRVYNDAEVVSAPPICGISTS